MNITNENDKREISQLWFVALYYFECAIKIKNEVPSEHLQKTVQEITDIYEKQAKSGCKEEIIPQDICKKIMLLNAHLGSCAVRLNTIDELLGKEYGTSSKWTLYEKLKNKNNENDIKDNAKKIIHFLLRHNIAHHEKEALLKQEYINMQNGFRRFTIGDLYKSIDLVMKEIEKDISSAIQKYSIYRIDFNCC